METLAKGSQRIISRKKNISNQFHNLPFVDFVKRIRKKKKEKPNRQRDQQQNL